MYTYMHACVSGCIYRHSVHMNTRTHTPRTHTHTRTHHTHMCTRAHTHTHTHIHTHTRTDTCTCTHIRTYCHTVHGCTCVYDVFFLLLWNLLAVSNEGQQQQERRRRECKREHFTEGERREANGVCERERVGGSAHAHTYVHTCMCVECWVHLHAHYGTHTSLGGRAFCNITHETH